MKPGSPYKRPTPNSRAFSRRLSGPRDTLSETVQEDSLPRKGTTRKPANVAKSAQRAPPTPTPSRLRNRLRLLRSGGSSSPVVSRKVVLSETKVLFTSPYATPSIRRNKTQGKFDYLQHLGEGVCGVVHRVRALEDKKMYALKRYKRAFGSIRERDKLLAAVALWSDIKPNLNVVPLYQAWQEDGFLCLQMHLCSGGSLIHYVSELIALKPSGWSEAVVLRCLSDSVSALQHIHAHKLLHNDVTPGNLYLCNDEKGVRVMLGDFDKVTKIEDVVVGAEGDARYMAKEVLSEQNAVASDVFSLGITFYELVAQVDLPENGEMWHKLRANLIPRWASDEYTSALFELITSMMHKDPKERPTTKHLLSLSSLVDAKDKDLVGIEVLTEVNLRSPPYLQANSHDVAVENAVSEGRISPSSHELSPSSSIATAGATPRRSLFRDFDGLNDLSGRFSSAAVNSPARKLF